MQRPIAASSPRFGAEFELNRIARPFPKRRCRLIACDEEVLPEIALAADDDMGARVPSLERIEGHPVEFRAEIGIGLARHIADKGFQV